MDADRAYETGANRAPRPSGDNGTWTEHASNPTSALHDDPATLACLAMQEVLDRLATGVFIVSATRHVVALNAEARRIVSAADGFSMDRGGKLDATGLDAHAFAREIGFASSSGMARALPAAGALQVQRAASGHYDVLICPLQTSQSSLAGPRMPVAAVLVSDPDCQRDSTALLRKLYGLTTAEARIAQAIASGQTPSEAARALGVTLNTVRWTLKHVYAKTGTRRQAELARRVISGPASFRIGPCCPAPVRRTPHV